MGSREGTWFINSLTKKKQRGNKSRKSVFGLFYFGRVGRR
jgi:hypothetical protein